jgi:glycosyltransferase involved in cell wall biosynthesis
MEKKEKILVCGILPPPFFGHSMMYKILMESAFIKAFDVTFLDMRFWSYAQHKKVTFLKLLKLCKYFLKYVFLIIVRRPRYVLYNMSFDRMPFLKDFIFCFVGKVFGCRIVLHDMGQYVKELYQSSGRVYRALMRWLLKKTTACILLGEHTKSMYEGFVDPRRLFSVSGSVEDTQRIVCAQTPPPNPSSDINVLYFSFMTKSKGALTAFKAAAQVLNSQDSVCFTFAGPIEPGTVQEEFIQLKNKFNSRIKHLGYIEDISERTRMYRGADIFIFPTHRDVFGLVLLHAMAEGLPVIASREGAIPEIIEDGKSGFLFPKGDHAQLAQRILLLAGEPQRREQMGRESRRRYEAHFTPEQYGKRMVDAFEQIGRLN